MLPMHDTPVSHRWTRGRQDRLSSIMAGRSLNALQSLAALPSNIAALEAGLLFGRGHRAQVAVIGPSGWGKTHLLQAVAETMRQELATEPVLVQAADWAATAAPGEPPVPLILDDVQSALLHPKLRHQFRMGLEHRVRTGRPTLLAITDHRPTRGTRSFLPMGREWAVAQIHEPSPLEREIVVRQIASLYGVQLSRAMERLIAQHVCGNGHSIVGAVQTLQLEKQDWSAPADHARACGVLHPYLVDFDGWDPLERAYEAVVQTIGDSGHPSAHWVTDVSCFLMLREMGVSEDKVSTFLGVSPTSAYARASAVERGMRDLTFCQAVEACKNAVLRRFEDG